MNIRKAQISDLSQLSELFDLYRIFYRKESDLSAAENFIRTRLEKEDAVIYVAESGDQLVGFTQLYPSFSSTRMQRMWILNDLYVRKTFRVKTPSVALGQYQGPAGVPMFRPMFRFKLLMLFSRVIQMCNSNTLFLVSPLSICDGEFSLEGLREQEIFFFLRRKERDRPRPFWLVCCRPPEIVLHWATPKKKRRRRDSDSL